VIRGMVLPTRRLLVKQNVTAVTAILVLGMTQSALIQVPAAGGTAHEHIMPCSTMPGDLEHGRRELHGGLS
jgi:hypothetical protein